jgi:UDP-N-acetylglucosamine 2-epimerase (non-hydrolysing)
MRIDTLGLKKLVERSSNLILIEPLGYFDFMKLTENSAFVLTDSGGIQEETSFLSLPCLTLRDETERPVTVNLGTNIVVGRDKKRVLAEVNKILNGKAKKGSIPPLWDGKTSKRIADIIEEKVGC